MNRSEDSKSLRRTLTKGYKTKFYAEYEALKKSPLFEQALSEVIALEKQKNAIESIEIHFSVNYSTVFGEKVAVVGDSDYLGNWDPSRAVEMCWNEGNIWKCTICCNGEIADLNYKYICIRGTLVKWENGENRVVDLKKGNRIGNKISVQLEEIWKR